MLMEMCMNKPSCLVHVGSRPLTVIRKYEGENILNRNNMFFAESISFFVCFSQSR